MIDYLLYLLYFAAFGAVIFNYTLLAFKLLIPFKNVSKTWPWYKKYPYGFLILVGFFADIIYNVVYAGFWHVFLAYKSRVEKPWSLFWPEFSAVTSYATLYKITYTKRVQHMVNMCNALGKRHTSMGRYSWKFGTMLNRYDVGHISIPKDWRRV